MFGRVIDLDAARQRRINRDFEVAIDHVTRTYVRGMMTLDEWLECTAGHAEIREGRLSEAAGDAAERTWFAHHASPR